MEKIGGGRGFEEGGQQFSLGHVSLRCLLDLQVEMLRIVAYLGLEIRREVSAGDINLGFNIYEF